MSVEKIIIKKSPFVFIKWLIVIEFFFAFLPFLSAAIFNANAAYDEVELSRTISYPFLITVIATVIQVLIITFTFIAWYVPQYVIYRGRVLYRRGNLYEEKLLLQLTPDLDFALHQGPLARRFDYGSLDIGRVDNELAKLKNIPNPENYRGMLIDISEHQLPQFTASTHQPAAELIQSGEGQTIEFKASLVWDYHLERANKDLYLPVMKNIAAFMNSQGGSLLIGVHDNGQILGLEKDLSTLRKPDIDGFENVFGQAFNKMIGAEFRHQATLLFPEIDSRTICQVEVAPSRQPIYLRDKGVEKFYIRTGNGSQSLSMSQAAKYIRSRFPVAIGREI